ncbi:MAG TPA: iron ABC transporter permease [Galbitalea sp.]|nr:iron ABC transporter permease [Galbitalea sp.]
MSGLVGEGLASVTRPRGARRGGRSRALTVVVVVIGVLLLLPLIAVIADAQSAGWSEISFVLFRPRSATLLLNTLALPLVVTPLAAVLGTAAAWFTERTALPGRRIWTILVVLPIAMPDFIVGYAWHTIAPTADPFAAAVLVMTLSSYPLIYLPASAALRRSDPALEEAAHSLGLSSTRTFFRVVLPSIRSAILAGCLIVVLVLVSEYGAFEIVRFQTFTTEVFTEFQVDPNAAGALSIPLVLIGILVVVGESLVPVPRSSARPGMARPSLVELGARAIAVAAGFAGLVVLSVGVPVGALLYWMLSSQHTTLPAQATVLQATLTTCEYCAGGALLAVLLAIPVAVLSDRRRRGLALVVERSTYLTLALPGVVIAVSLIFLALRFAFGLYETSWLVIVGYAIITFPLALSCVKTSVRQAPAELTAMGRSLGRSGVFVFLRVTLPLLAPGLVAGFCLVFLTASTELTATLVLQPPDTVTLSTQFWAFQSETAYGAAAPYGLVIIVLSMVPGTLLAIWFDRLGHRQAKASNQ